MELKDLSESDYKFRKDGNFGCCNCCPFKGDTCVGRCSSSPYHGDIYQYYWRRLKRSGIPQRLAWLCPKCFDKLLKKKKERVEFT